MKTELLRGRTFYRSSGSVNWLRFLPWACLLFAGSAVGALILFFLFQAGMYLIIIVPAIAALGVAGLANLAVAKGHCRNRLIAALTGFMAGVLLYFGYYYIGMVATLGPQAAAEIQLLPKYIRFRMATDVVRDVGDTKTDEEGGPKHKREGMSNWVGFTIETVLVLGFTTLPAYRRSRKAYCDQCGHWMQRELTYFEPGKAQEIMSALETGSPRTLAAIFSGPVFATIPNTSIALEYCPTLKEGRGRDCPLFISVKSVTDRGGGAKLDPFEQSKGKMLVRRAQLTPDELPAVALRFSFLENYTGRSAVAALAPEPERLEDEAKPGAVADIRAVEPDYAGKVLTRRTKLIGNAIALSSLLMLFAALGLMAWGGLTAFPTGAAPTVSVRVLGIALLAMGGVLFVACAIFFLINPSYLGNRYLLKIVKHEFAKRPKPLVQPDDPEALFVEIVPKMNWGKISLETASDVGFLRVDRARREVLFEGDKERCRIPAEAITYAEVEYFVEGQGTHAATKMYYVILRAAHPTRFWEAPIRERTGAGIFRSRSRKKSAFSLLSAIREIQGKAPVDALAGKL